MNIIRGCKARSGVRLLTLMMLAMLSLGMMGFAAERYSEKSTYGVTTPIKQVIVLDLTGVLVTYSRGALLWDLVLKVGFKRLLSLFPFHVGRVMGLESALMQLWHEALPQQGQYLPMCDELGRPMPPLMCEFNLGNITAAEARRRIHETLDRWVRENAQAKRTGHTCVRPWPVHGKVAEALLRQTSDTVFSATGLPNTFKTLAEGMELLGIAAQRRASHGDVAILILSNFPPEQFGALMQQPCMQEIASFVLPEHFFVSGRPDPYGDPVSLKPNPQAFQSVLRYCAREFGVSPGQVVFFDNQLENIEAAAREGILSILVNASPRKDGTVPCQNFSFQAAQSFLRDLCTKEGCFA